MSASGSSSASRPSRARIEGARHPAFEKPTWKPKTEVGKVLSGLTADIDLAGLEKLGALTPKERTREKRLTENLLKDPVAAAAKQRLFADCVKQLCAVIEAAAANYADDALTRLKSLAGDARAKREAADLAADKAFGGLAVPGVGGEAWRALWEAARHYAEHTAYPGKPFPPKGDESCLLCQQPLDAAARGRMASFESFIREDTEARAEAAEAACNEAVTALRAKKVSIAPVAQTRRRIAIEDAALARSVIRFLAASRLRRNKCLAAIGTGGALELPELPPSPAPAVAAFERALRDYAAELDNAADAEGRRALQEELDELTDRIAVEQLLPIARSEVERLKALKLLADCLPETATNSITNLGNDIADKVITPRIRDQFQSEVVRLAADKVRVEVVRSGGQYGSPQYQVRLRESHGKGPYRAERRRADLRGPRRLPHRACDRAA